MTCPELCDRRSNRHKGGRDFALDRIMTRELNDLLGELIDVLVQVPRLWERAGRDAWLSKNLKRNVQSQIRRDDNCRNDLTFIVRDSHSLRLRGGRWVLLILLDDLIQELEGTTLGDKIQEVRIELESSLEMSRESRPGDGDLIVSDPKRREWLKRLGFKRDPFRYIDGGTDPFLQEYFYSGMRHFHDISRPGTVFVFGPPGSGKSSMRNVISQLGQDDKVFCIVYQDFGLLVNKHGDGEEVHIKDHVEQILRVALRTLVEADRAVESDEQETKIMRNQLWLYASRYERDPLRRHALMDLLKPDLEAEGALPLDDIRELIGRFCRYVTKLFGYQSVYVLVDPDNDIDPDEEIAWQVLEPLIMARRVLELSEDKVVFKFFLSQRFQKRVLQIPWIKQERSKRVYPLKWSDEELRALLQERLAGCSGGRYKNLGELSEVDDLDDRVVRLSMGSPRELIVICNRLFSEHSRKWSPDDGEPLLITDQEVEEVLSPFEERYPKSPLEQLIARGESERVEFKSTMRYNLRAGRPDKEIEREIARTICAFMNTEGGTLIIGVDDDGTVLGLDKDFSTLGRRKNEDGFHQAFVNITENLFNPPLSPDDYAASFEKCHDKLVYVVKVKKSEKPAFCLFSGVNEFYLRKQTTTRKLDAKATLEYCLEHF